MSRLYGTHSLVHHECALTDVVVWALGAEVKVVQEDVGSGVDAPRVLDLVPLRHAHCDVDLSVRQRPANSACLAMRSTATQIHGKASGGSDMACSLLKLNS